LKIAEEEWRIDELRKDYHMIISVGVLGRRFHSCFTMANDVLVEFQPYIIFEVN
jgi:hypothetical protein